MFMQMWMKIAGQMQFNLNFIKKKFALNVWCHIFVVEKFLLSISWYLYFCDRFSGIFVLYFRKNVNWGLEWVDLMIIFRSSFDCMHWPNVKVFPRDRANRGKYLTRQFSVRFVFSEGIVHPASSEGTPTLYDRSWIR